MLVRINDFCKKHGVNKRSVDYWTNIGILHPEVNPNNGYRDYGARAEDDMQRIKLTRILNNGRVTKEDVEALEYYSSREWRDKVKGQIYNAYRESNDLFSSLMDYINDKIERLN